MQFPDDQYVEDEYEHERYGEAEDERVERERGLAAEQIVLRPYDVAAHHVALVHGVGVHDHRYHEYDAERPRGDRHDLRHVRGAHLGRRYRMADGDVPVSAHDHQEYAAGELVHAGRRHVHLDANNGLFKNVSGWGGRTAVPTNALEPNGISMLVRKQSVRYYAPEGGGYDNRFEIEFRHAFRNLLKRSVFERVSVLNRFKQFLNRSRSPNRGLTAPFWASYEQLVENDAPGNRDEVNRTFSVKSQGCRKDGPGESKYSQKMYNEKTVSVEGPLQ